MGGTLARLCEILPDDDQGASLKRILTLAAGHLLPAQPVGADACQVINAHRDARSNIERSRTQRHQTEIERRIQYDQQYGALQQVLDGRERSGVVSVNSPRVGQLKEDELDLHHHHDVTPVADLHPRCVVMSRTRWAELRLP